MPDHDQRPHRTRSGWATAAAGPWMLVAAAGLGVAAGLGLDRWLGTSPWAAAAGSLAGIAAGIWMLIREGDR